MLAITLVCADKPHKNFNFTRMRYHLPAGVTISKAFEGLLFNKYAPERTASPQIVWKSTINQHASSFVNYCAIHLLNNRI
jgi:hypothetical protein